MSDGAAAARGPDSWGSRLGVIAVELALLGAAWWYLGLDWVLVAVFAAVIIGSGLLPERWRMLGSGVGCLGLAALMYFHYMFAQMAALLGVFALVLISVGAVGLIRRR